MKNIVAILISGYSITCYYYKDGSYGKYIDCTDGMNNFAKELECLKNGKDKNLSKLASEFSNLRQECLANFDSCYSIRDSHYYGGCSCMGGYLYGIKHLDMKMGECRKFNQAEWQDLKSKNDKILNLV